MFYFCLDINECQLKTNNCSSKAECLNYYGGFECKCLPGFSGDGIFCTGKLETQHNSRINNKLIKKKY